jgi:hypothetical protein
MKVIKRKLPKDIKRKSKTVQHDTPSIQQLIRNHTGIMPNPEGFLDADIHKISRFHRKDLDLVDLQELHAQNLNLAKSIAARKEEIIEETKRLQEQSEQSQKSEEKSSSEPTT